MRWFILGFFDRFRKRIKKVADDTDIESLTAEEDSEEALAALAKREESELQRNKEIETPVELISSEEDWDDISDIKAESMVAHKEAEIKAGHKTKGYKYAFSLTGIPLVINVVKNLRRGDRWSALWGGSDRGDDDDDLDA